MKFVTNLLEHSCFQFSLQRFCWILHCIQFVVFRALRTKLAAETVVISQSHELCHWNPKANKLEISRTLFHKHYQFSFCHRLQFYPIISNPSLLLSGFVYTLCQYITYLGSQPCYQIENMWRHVETDLPWPM